MVPIPGKSVKNTGLHLLLPFRSLESLSKAQESMFFPRFPRVFSQVWKPLVYPIPLVSQGGYLQLWEGKELAPITYDVSASFSNEKHWAGSPEAWVQVRVLPVITFGQSFHLSEPLLPYCENNAIGVLGIKRESSIGNALSGFLFCAHGSC